MNTLATTQGTVGESLSVKVKTEINNELHHPFIVRYSAEQADNIIHDLANIPAISLVDSQLFETWYGVSSNASCKIGEWQFFQNEQYLIASVPISLLENMPVDQATEKAYSLVFDQMNSWGYHHLIRTWNFFPNITDEEFAGSNNYQLFCSGRARAYKNQPQQISSYPAATVIGTHQPGVHIYFIAAKQQGIGIENAHQVSAFNYPQTYSQDPPLFSRALLHKNNTQQILFISGTASILGHSTQYSGDINRQTEVCLSNIEHLISSAVNEHHFPKLSLQEFSQFKVYIKNLDDLNTVRTHIYQLLGPSAPIYFLQGDMCRSDLLVEIEALAISI